MRSPGAACCPSSRSYPNLLVMRTLSKSGLAGLRLGLIGRREWLAQIDKVRLPYNVNVLTQLVAEKCCGIRSLLDEQAAAILDRAHAPVANALRRMPAVDAFPSDANFICFRTARAMRVFDGLKQRGVLIKNLHGSHPRSQAACASPSARRRERRVSSPRCSESLRQAA